MVGMGWRLVGWTRSEAFQNPCPLNLFLFVDGYVKLQALST
jgi:hypothetical protein